MTDYWLERRARAHDERDPAIISSVARHRDLAGERRAAHLGYRRAGELSLELFAYGEAADLLGRARQLADGDEDDWQLCERMGDALAHARSIAAGEEVYREALAKAAGDRLGEARLCQKLGHCARQRGEVNAAVEWFERGLAHLAGDEAAEPRVAAALRGGLGWILGYRMGEIERVYGGREIVGPTEAPAPVEGAHDAAGSAHPVT